MNSDTAVLVAASLAAFAAVVGLVAAIMLVTRVAELRRTVDRLEADVVPLVRDARIAAEEAASEMTRVGDVLGSAEAVSATVDSASRLAYRAFSNPVVKVLAFGSGTSRALQRLLGRNHRVVPVDVVARPERHHPRRSARVRART
ncbi:MAG: hypothetical protein ACYDD4_13280 [Acidimicrobiales bacterium]